MNKHIVWHLHARKMQHRRPEQRVKVGNVLADEVILLGRWICHEGIKVATGFAEIIFQRGEVANRCVQPDIKILARCIRNFDPKVGRITADIPIAQSALALQPFAGFVRHFGLQARRIQCPLAQELAALRIRQLKEVMLGRLHHRRCACERGVGIFQIGRRVHSAAGFAGIAVLIFRTALRAFAFDVAIRQKHIFHRIKKLFDATSRDQLRVITQTTIDFLRERMIFFAIGGVPIVKRNMEAIEILFATRSNICHKGLRCEARFFGSNHDRRTMRIIGAHKMHLVVTHAHEAYPDIGLDVLHDVPNVKRAIGIGQGSGNENLAGMGGAHCVWVTIKGKPRFYQ